MTVTLLKMDFIGIFQGLGRDFKQLFTLFIILEGLIFQNICQ